MGKICPNCKKKFPLEFFTKKSGIICFYCFNCREKARLDAIEYRRKKFGEKKEEKVNNITITHPLLVNEWDFAKNTINIKSLSYSSHQKVHWKCCKDSSHEWEASLNARTNKSAPTKCPFCYGQSVCENNCLKTTHPRLIKEWDFDTQKQEKLIYISINKDRNPLQK